ncbi:glycosyl hydrolase [Streptomyces sp. NPDC006512]|uniref:glycoside hydrolase family 26 protein n=1 Tax=Streptomyces sp. NPDC006512 TaxID=3154307 RepID=UPI0033AE6758
MTISLRRCLTAAVLAGSLLAGTVGCNTFSSSGRDEYKMSAGDSGSGAGSRTSAAPALPYDVRPLLQPKNKYLGLAADGAPESMKPVEKFASDAGKKPNVIEFYSAWGDQYETKLVRNAWEYGAVPFIAWEPMKKSLADISSGREDGYIRAYARSVRETNLPVALSFAHEMNGHWYPWGTKNATPQQFVEAYKHVHDVFQQEGATQVIWVWSPNVINPMPTVRLQPYWPGDNYVDWVGVVGYYGKAGPATYETLYGPTMTEIRRFTQKPFLIAETAAESGTRKSADIADLFQGTLKRDDVIGFIWFDFDKEADWRITSTPEAARSFRKQAENPRFGFDVKKP